MVSFGQESEVIGVNALLSELVAELRKIHFPIIKLK